MALMPPKRWRVTQSVPSLPNAKVTSIVADSWRVKGAALLVFYDQHGFEVYPVFSLHYVVSFEPVMPDE